MAKMVKIRIRGVQHKVSQAELDTYEMGGKGAIANLQQQHMLAAVSLNPADPLPPLPPVTVVVSKKNRTLVFPKLSDVPGAKALFKPWRKFYKDTGLTKLITG